MSVGSGDGPCRTSDAVSRRAGKPEACNLHHMIAVLPSAPLWQSGRHGRRRMRLVGIRRGFPIRHDRGNVFTHRAGQADRRQGAARVDAGADRYRRSPHQRIETRPGRRSALCFVREPLRVFLRRRSRASSVRQQGRLPAGDDRGRPCRRASKGVRTEQLNQASGVHNVRES